MNFDNMDKVGKDYKNGEIRTMIDKEYIRG